MTIRACRTCQERFSAGNTARTACGVCEPVDGGIDWTAARWGAEGRHERRRADGRPVVTVADMEDIHRIERLARERKT